MQPKTIVHFRTGIGNFVVFTPALQAIASMDPTGKVDLCTDPIWTDYRKAMLCDIWERLPCINRVLSYKEIKKEDYATWFWTYWTSAGEACGIFKKIKHYEAPDWDQNVEHESDYYMRIARDYYGYKGEKPKQLIVPANKPILDFPGKKKVVICNGGFGDINVFKKWDLFDNFAKELKSFYTDTVVIKIGYGNELKSVEADVDYVGKLTITETAKVLQQADLAVTTDTGNMHIGDALGTPMIVLWGGSSLPKNKPYESVSKIVHLGLSCQPCQQDGAYRSCEDYKCISDITIGEVMHSIRNFFNKGNFDGNNP